KNFNDKLTKVNDEIINYQKRQKYDEVWYRFKNSFSQNQNDFINDLLASYKNAFGSMELRNLNSIVLILKALNKEEKAVEIMKDFFEKKAEYLKEEDTFYNPIPNDLDEEVKNLYRETIKESEIIKPLDKVLDKVLSHGWSNKDEEMLKFYKIEDYYKLFISDNENVGHYVSKLIIWSKSHNNSFQVEAGKIAVEALKRIWNESDFNKIKLQKVYKLDFDSEDEN
ncbi:MAG: hypothetical protein U9P73_06020, partial [Candidatus Cloacimonadota bacterium]|nr:hypothetical protein [Candidatus Cloacimonadota bacterium]